MTSNNKLQKRLKNKFVACLTIILDNSFFDIKGYFLILSLLSIIVILLVSKPKPAPLSFNEFKIIASRFLSFSFFFALSI